MPAERSRTEIHESHHRQGLHSSRRRPQSIRTCLNCGRQQRTSKPTCLSCGRPIDAKTYGYLSRSTGEAVRDALKAAGYTAQLAGKWNVNGGTVKVFNPDERTDEVAHAAAREQARREG